MNLIHIHSHDTGKLISPYGYNLPTPNLEEFSAESICFDNYFTVSPTCSPSRGATMTGLYPSSNGLIGLTHRNFELIRKDMHVANILKSNGYETVLCGIQHENSHYNDISTVKSAELGYMRNLTNPDNCGEESWDLDNLKLTLEFLDNYDFDKPLFLSHGTFSTHRPYYNDNGISKSTYHVNSKFSNEDIDKDNQDFHYSLKVFDDIIGEILQKLKEKNVLDDSLIIVTTDHGIADPECKCNLNDEGCNIMLMMKIPGYARLNGTKNKFLLSNIDLMPTLYDIIGIDQKEKLDGKSFKSILDGDEQEINEYIFGEVNFHTSHEPMISVRTKHHRLTIKLDKDFDKVSWSNIDASPSKELYFSWFAKSNKKMEILTDYRHHNIFDQNEDSVKEDLKRVLLAWDSSRYKQQYNLKDKLVNKNTDYFPSINKN